MCHLIFVKRTHPCAHNTSTQIFYMYVCDLEKPDIFVLDRKRPKVVDYVFCGGFPSEGKHVLAKSKQDRNNFRAALLKLIKCVLICPCFSLCVCPFFLQVLFFCI